LALPADRQGRRTRSSSGRAGPGERREESYRRRSIAIRLAVLLSGITSTKPLPGSHAIPPRLQAVLGETEAALRGIYGDRFRGLVLFGSQARGRAVPGSDIDLVLLLEKSDGARERRHCSEAVAELSLRHDTVISLVPIGIEEAAPQMPPFPVTGGGPAVDQVGDLWFANCGWYR
jgi:predicted nucleotidyltransferase